SPWRSARPTCCGARSRTSSATPSATPARTPRSRSRCGPAIPSTSSSRCGTTAAASPKACCRTSSTPSTGGRRPRPLHGRCRSRPHHRPSDHSAPRRHRAGGERARRRARRGDDPARAHPHPVGAAEVLQARPPDLTLLVEVLTTGAAGARYQEIMRRARRWSIALGIIALLGAGAYLFLARSGAAPGRTPRSPAGGRAPAAPGMAMAAQTADMAVYLSGLGSVTPLNTVTVRTRVEVELPKVLFREGQIVRAGDLLAEIDPRPFQVQLTQVEGQLARDEALLRNARVDLERYKTLVAQDSIPTQQLDTQVELVRQYEGVVKTDQGQIDNVKLQLVYCRITAPLNGRLGLRLVDPGNIVHASDQNGLVVITQLQPIAVVFTIPEDSLPPVLKKLNAGVELPVDAWDRDQRQRLAAGSLLTV